jgi:hypothetical protein
MTDWTQNTRYARPTWFSGDVAIQYCEPPWCQRPEYRIWRRVQAGQWRDRPSIQGWMPGEAFDSFETAVNNSKTETK